MTDRIRAQHGNVIVGDFSREQSLELSVAVDTIYADEFVIVIRCRVGDHVWHTLGDVATSKVIST